MGTEAQFAGGPDVIDVGDDAKERAIGETLALMPVVVSAGFVDPVLPLGKEQRATEALPRVRAACRHGRLHPTPLGFRSPLEQFPEASDLCARLASDIGGVRRREAAEDPPEPDAVPVVLDAQRFEEEACAECETVFDDNVVDERMALGAVTEVEYGEDRRRAGRVGFAAEERRSGRFEFGGSDVRQFPAQLGRSAVEFGSLPLGRDGIGPRIGRPVLPHEPLPSVGEGEAFLIGQAGRFKGSRHGAPS
ncbi:hypothetical protein GCM10027447_26690 [Glycomyces halotolerans]